MLDKPLIWLGSSRRDLRVLAVYVLHAFEKKTQKTSAQDLRIGRDRFRVLGKLRQQHGKEERG